MGVWRKLKGDNVKIIEDLDNKGVKRGKTHVFNRLTKSHIAARMEVQYFIFNGPVTRTPQPKLMRDETQLLVGKT